MVTVLEATRSLIAGERLGAVVTVVDGPGTGLKAVIDRADGVVAGELPDGLTGDILSDAASLMDREQNRTLGYDGASVYIETVAPQPHLLIFGAVHIAQELCRIGHGLGFRVTVNDARSAFTTEARFPEAAEVIVGWPDVIADQLTIDARTYVVLLSHGCPVRRPRAADGAQEPRQIRWRDGFAADASGPHRASPRSRLLSGPG